MEDEPTRGEARCAASARGYRLLQGSGDDAGAHAGRHGETEYALAATVLNEGRVNRALAAWHVGEISDPHPVRLDEVPIAFHQVRQVTLKRCGYGRETCFWRLAPRIPAILMSLVTWSRPT